MSLVGMSDIAAFFGLSLDVSSDAMQRKVSFASRINDYSKEQIDYW